MAVRRSVWAVGVLVLAAVVVMLMVRGCVGEGEMTVDPRHADADASEWLGTVVESKLDPRGRPQVEVDFGDRVKTIAVARVIAPVCGPSRAPVVDDLLPRLNALLPPGSAVRVVRATTGATMKPVLSSDSGYIYAAASPAAGSTSTPTAGATTVTTPTAQQPETTPSGATTSAEPTAVQGGPLPGSVNEVLLAEGLVMMTDPYFDLSVAAGENIDAKIAAARSFPERDSAWVTHLLGVYSDAWNNSVGVQAQCRADSQARVAEWEQHVAEEARKVEAEAAAAEVRRQQQAQLDALRAGPDGRLYTADDDHTTYGFDANGNLYSVPTPVPTPTYSSGGSGGGSGGGGESWFCRRKWWC